MGIPVTWHHYGTLSDFEAKTSGGVYVFVYQRRIVYVGTAEVFSTRWSSHAKEARIGARTFWRPKPDEDVYQLMHHPPGDEDAYKKISLSRRAWFVGYGKNENRYVNGLYGDVFDDDWQQFLETYMSELQIWACELEGGATTLESQLQLSLISQFRIGYYKKWGHQSWLGKVESSKSAMEAISFTHTNKPDADAGTTFD